MPGGGEPAHVGADLGDDDRGGDRADPGDLLKPGHGVSERAQLGFDALVDLGDVSADRVNPGEHLGQQERVMVGEVPVERLLQLAHLRAQPHPGHLR